jgi:hypothetical protein
MKSLALFMGLVVIFIGVEPNPSTPLWMILLVIGTGLSMFWWGCLPKMAKNRRR